MRTLFIVLCVFCGFGLIFTGVINIGAWVNFKSGCTDYLKLAADSPNVEGARKYLGMALTYIESHSLTHGNSAFFFFTPRNDIGAWYNQRKEAAAVLDSIIEETKISTAPPVQIQLEKDNTLMKLREVVLDQGQEGVGVTLPQHIDVYPNQNTFLWSYLLCPILGIVFGIVAYRFGRY